MTTVAYRTGALLSEGLLITDRAVPTALRPDRASRCPPGPDVSVGDQAARAASALFPVEADMSRPMCRLHLPHQSVDPVVALIWLLLAPLSAVLGWYGVWRLICVLVRL